MKDYEDGNAPWYPFRTLIKDIDCQDVTYIGNYSFCRSALLAADLPAGLQEIGIYAFFECDSLEYVYIAEGITEIGSFAFNRCTDLDAVYCQSREVPLLGNFVFHNNADARIIYVPKLSVSDYQHADNWSSYDAFIKARYGTSGGIDWEFGSGELTIK